MWPPPCWVGHWTVYCREKCICEVTTHVLMCLCVRERQRQNKAQRGTEIRGRGDRKRREGVKRGGIKGQHWSSRALISTQQEPTTSSPAIHNHLGRTQREGRRPRPLRAQNLNGAKCGPNFLLTGQKIKLFGGIKIKTLKVLIKKKTHTHKQPVYK